jgi:hypothetical protein
MTSKEYFDNTKKHIEEIIRYDVKAESVKPESVYMDRALKHFKLLFTKQPGRKGSFVWKPHELKALNDIWTEIMPELEKAISGAIHRYMKRKMVTEINAVSGEALVNAAMSEANLTYRYTAQMYRAKIEVKLNDKNALTFYISYKKIGEELPKAVSAAKSLIEILNSFGPNTSIRKTYGFGDW